jgi:hypothetical protein
MRRLFAALVVCSSIGFAQSDIWKYSKSATLSGTATAFTIALPDTGPGQQVEILEYTLQCTADCTVQTERNGSAPTATAATWRCEDVDTCPKNGTTPIQPVSKIYHLSNSTGGGLHDEPYIFPANAIVPWKSGTALVLTGLGSTNNFTIRIAAFTGTYHFTIRARIRR